MEREDSEPELDPTQLLNLAQTHLRLQNFSLSQQYSLELLSSATHLRRTHRLLATQTLTISSTLSAASTTTTPNHYTVLQLDYFSDNHNLIHTHYKNILSILDPIKNSSPLAQQSLDLIHKAYNCLSDPAKKAVFDTQLRNQLVGGDGGNVNSGVFWTFCPYCYYVYEYDKVYQGCSLRCQNLGCRRVFHGVSLGNLAKNELDKGMNFGSFGYFPLGVSVSKEVNKFDSWSPFVGMVRNSHVNGTTCVEELDDESDESDEVPNNVDLDLEKNDNGAGVGVDVGIGVGGGGGGGIVGDLNEADMTFFEEGGEIFVDVGDEEDAM